MKVAGSEYLGTNANTVHAGGDAGAQERALREKQGRYELLRFGQSLLWDADQEDPKKQHRTCWCHRALVHASQMVEVHKRQDGFGARFGGVQQCGSVWACPVCAAKVAEVRRREIVEAAEVHARLDGSMYLMTLTFPHDHEQPLQQLMDMFTKALQKFKNSRTYDRVMKSWLRKGSVRSLEVTHGKNGWHPHTHDLVFARAGVLGDQADRTPEMYSGDVADLRDEWIRALRKTGLDAGRPDAWLIRRAFQIQGGDAASEYIAKFGRDVKGWGISREMTGNASKVGRVTTGADADVHATPFQLLAWAATGDDYAGGRFREYVAAMTGKRMITWSPGLRKSLNLSEVLTEEEIKERQEGDAQPDEMTVAVLDIRQWRDLVKRNRVGEFLAWVAMWGTCQQDIDEWIEVCVRRVQAVGSGVLAVKRQFGGGYAYTR